MILCMNWVLKYCRKSTDFIWSV